MVEPLRAQAVMRQLFINVIMQSVPSVKLNFQLTNQTRNAVTRKANRKSHTITFLLKSFQLLKLFIAQVLNINGILPTVN
jgi:hypothetical protein